MSLKEWDNDPVIPFPPVLENFLDAEEEAFMPHFRYSKHSFDIPWLVGLTSEEGLLKTSGKVCELSHRNFSLQTNFPLSFLQQQKADG